MKQYKKLTKYQEYDKEAAEELAEAVNEITQLKGRIQYLEELVNENEELHLFLWTTAENKTIAIHNLEDDHLRNILNHLADNGKTINKALRAEAEKRKIPIPVVNVTFNASQGLLQAALKAGLID